MLRNELTPDQKKEVETLYSKMQRANKEVQKYGGMLIDLNKMLK